VEALQAGNRRMTRDQRRSLWLGHAIAGKLVTDPERTLSIARENLARLQEANPRGGAARRLAEWPLVSPLLIVSRRPVRGRQVRGEFDVLALGKTRTSRSLISVSLPDPNTVMQFVMCCIIRASGEPAMASYPTSPPSKDSMPAIPVVTVREWRANGTSGSPTRSFTATALALQASHMNGAHFDPLGTVTTRQHSHRWIRSLKSKPGHLAGSRSAAPQWQSCGKPLLCSVS
jgi:hypothetical protein